MYLEHSRGQDLKNCYWEQSFDRLAMRGTGVKVELSRQQEGVPRGQPPTQGVEEPLAGRVGARSKGARPASGTSWRVDRQSNSNLGAGWMLLGQCTGGWQPVAAFPEVRPAPVRQLSIPAGGRWSPQLGGTGGLSGQHSQALVTGG